MVPDIHIHTYLCKHAEGMPDDFLAIAERKLLPAICFTDHIPAPDGYDPSVRMDIKDYSFYRKLIEELRPSEKTKVLLGIEADYYPGCEKFLIEWLPKQKFDMVIGSVHYIGDWGFDNPLYLDRWTKVNIDQVWQEYFKLVGKLADMRLFDVVGHLDVAKRFGFRPDDRTIREIASDALDKIAAAKMAIEINTSGLRRPVKEIYPSPDLLKMARKRNIPIVFGSDAHKADEVGYAFDEAISFAKKCGYTETLIFKDRKAMSIPLP